VFFYFVAGSAFQILFYFIILTIPISNTIAMKKVKYNLVQQKKKIFFVG
jgi:hypothetical protein